MSKYYDELIGMNESLEREMKERGLALQESDDEQKMSVPIEDVPDDVKKDVLINDLKVDKDIVAGMKPEEVDGAIKSAQSGEQKNESDNDEYFIVRMDDDDIDMHGFVAVEDGEMELVENEDEATNYFTKEDAERDISMFCDEFNYDPDTFEIQPHVPNQVLDSTESEHADNEVTIDDTETWVSLDPMNHNATTLG